MAKAQMSLELMLYLSLAAIAILIAASESIRMLPKAEGIISTYSTESLAEEINSGIMAGNATIYTYIPKGLCNATASGYHLSTRYGEFSEMALLALSGSPFCPGGSYTRLYLEYEANGTVVVSK